MSQYIWIIYEKNKFLKIYDTQLAQNEIENLNSHTTIKEIGIKSLNDATKKSSDSDDFTGEFYYIFKEKQHQS